MLLTPLNGYLWNVLIVRLVNEDFSSFFEKLVNAEAGYKAFFVELLDIKRGVHGASAFTTFGE